MTIRRRGLWETDPMDPRTVFDWYPLTNLLWFGRTEESPEIIALDPDPRVLIQSQWVARVEDKARNRVETVEIDQRVIGEMTTPDGFVFLVDGGLPWEQQMAEVAAEVNAAAERVAARFITQ